MKRSIIALSLFAAPAFAQQTPPPIAMPQPLLQNISNFLLNGGTHNEAAALNQSMIDAVTADRERTANKAAKDAKDAEIAKLKPPPAP